MQVRVSAADFQAIRDRMAKANERNMSKFIRDSILGDSQQSLDPLSRLLRMATSLCFAISEDLLRKIPWIVANIGDPTAKNQVLEHLLLVGSEQEEFWNILRRIDAELQDNRPRRVGKQAHQ